MRNGTARMRQIGVILLTVVCLMAMPSCSSEDDVTEIFNGRRFKITGLTYNGTKVISDVKQFYEDENTYYIVFNSRTFTGALQAGTVIEGTWNANGDTRSFSMAFGNATSLTGANSMCNNVYNVLVNATSYSGDSNVLRIIKDKDTYIELSSQ